MKFYNSLTRQQEEFIPIQAGQVGLYTCGPTVYNYAHIGNFRAYVFEDILRRALEFCGYEVRQVMNLTDVDDKTIRGSQAQHVALNAFTQVYKDAFFGDLKTLGVQPAAVYPAATEHIPEMIALIEKLFEKGLAYQSEDGSVYFRVANFADYGKLAHLDREGMRHGVRIASDEYEKDAVGDFALWKAWDAADGDVFWESPWGRGRPGWHIECSAMSMKYLGESFDIHTGGIDNLFPHHENEIAQAEGATGQPFVRTWLHCAHLRVNGEKMSKSLGNFLTLRDLLQKGYTGREIRYVLISGHYRQPLNFTFDALLAARSALGRVDEFVRLLETKAAGSVATEPSSDWVLESLAQFRAALEDDLNLAEALSAVHRMVSHGNKLAEEGGLTLAVAASARAALKQMDRVLNVLEPPKVEIPQAVWLLVEARQAARKERNWTESDRLRNEILSMGWAVKDTPEGPQLTPQASVLCQE